MTDKSNKPPIKTRKRKDQAAAKPPNAGSSGIEHVPNTAEAAQGLARVLDVQVQLTVRLGQRRVKIAEVLDLAPGSVVEFSKAADEPLDVLVNDQLVARGEAVVIGERYGVRVTEVVSPNERLLHSGVVKESA